MRWFSWVGYALVALLVILWDVSVRPYIQPFSYIEPLLPMVTILALLQERRAAWVIGVLGAVGLDLFRFTGFPLATLFFCLYLLGVQLLATHVITSRSFYSAFTLLCLGRFLGWALLYFTSERFVIWPMAFGLSAGIKGVGIQMGVDALWILLWYSAVSYWARRGPRRYAQPRWFG